MRDFGPRLAVLLSMAAAMCVPSTVEAQASPLVLEIHGGASVPVGSFHDGVRPGEGGTPAASFGVDFALSGEGRRTLYVGFSQHRFGCEDAGCQAGGEYVATGFDLGLRINLRTSGSVLPWLRLGAVSTRVELPAVQGAAQGVSGLGLGGEAGLGLYIGTYSPVALVPGIRVTAVNTELPGGTLLRMRYVVADVALAFAF